MIIDNPLNALFKLGKDDVNHIENSGLIISGSQDLSVVATVMFDITSQLSIDMTLYNITTDPVKNDEIIEYFENLSVIYNKKISIIKKKANPIREVMKQRNLLQIFPLTKGVVQRTLWDVLDVNNIEKQYTFLRKFHQIFIPVNV